MTAKSRDRSKPRKQASKRKRMSKREGENLAKKARKREKVRAK